MHTKIMPQQGNNNVTEIVGDRVLKTPSHNGAAFLELSYEKQAMLWNKYYADTDYATAYVTDDGKLSTPYIEGSYPDDKQRLAVCETMLQKKFIMVDCRDKRNFIVNNEGKTCPIDFGQIHTEEHRFYHTFLSGVQREMATIKAALNHPQRSRIFQFQPQHNPFLAVEDFIGELEKYKLNLAKHATGTLVRDKIIQIDLFVVDTRTRIKQFNDGNKHAFDDYIEANQASLKILAQNRISRPILYSILLSFMLVPMIVGVIQLAITQGNTFLFLTAVKGSEKRALNVQNKVMETKEKLIETKQADPDEYKKLGSRSKF